jgi:eukaryotic-like serine/threonine-protein kinase
VSEGSPTEAFGPYLVYEQLGVGGMAQVHRAIATTSEFQRPVALKRMLSHIAGSEDMVKSFVREARLASYLRHENVAQTYDLGKVGEIYFIVMELITGRNLREVLRHLGATTGPMPVQIALNILNQICDALDYAHNLRDETGQPLGIIHRDVSPSNVIVSDGGVVKLIDFGIAKASAVGMQTMGGTLKGKFGYMAPEYIAGRIDARADLFAVGVIAHELLTNRPLFSGRDDIDTLTRVRDMRIEPPSKKNPQVPPEIDDIVMTALARDPDRRWQHATALRTALTTLTRRLGLIATNTQVIQWLDWGFAQTPRPRRKSGSATEPASASDTDEDGDPLSEDPSISVEQLTVELSSASKKVTRLDRGAAAEAPPGSPGDAPGPRAGTAPRPTANGVAPADRRPSGPRIASPSAAPPLATPSRGHPAAAPSSAPQRANRTHPASAPPPVAVQTLRAHSSSVLPPMGAPSRPHPSSTPPPLTSQVPLSSAPMPVLPGFHATPPAAPRPSGLGTSPLPVDARSSKPETPMSSQTSHLTLVILVILAAAVAATTVYFVLPLLT